MKINNIEIDLNGIQENLLTELEKTQNSIETTVEKMIQEQNEKSRNFKQDGCKYPHIENLELLENFENLSLADKERLTDEIVRHDFCGKDTSVPALAEFEIDILKKFINTRYEDNTSYGDFGFLYGYWNWDKEKKQQNAMSIVDLRDLALRVAYDEIEINVLAEGIDDSVEYLLKNLYQCKSNNDYDYNFLWRAINKEIFLYNVCGQVMEYEYYNDKLVEITGY